MNRRLPFFLLLQIMVLVGVVAEGQKSPRQTIAALKPARGLQLRLWASEPALTNPTNIAVDERGRVWVLEGVNYRRTQRNQPDLRPAGDRIVIPDTRQLRGNERGTSYQPQDEKLRLRRFQRLRWRWPARSWCGRPGRWGRRVW